MNQSLVAAARISELLGENTMWHSVEVVASTGSTNADLVRAAREGASAGRVLIAREQTTGRGRRIRSWASPPERSIAMSILVEPALPMERWGWLSLIAGLAVTEALESLAGTSASVQLKWPNDVLINEKKICGILSEAVPNATANKAVVGLGVNISLRRDELPVPTATSLLLEGLTQDQNAVAAAILDRFQQRYEQWQRSGSVREAYAARCTSLGRALRISVSEDSFVEGRGHGIDADGRLLVATAAGIEAFAVGDVVHAGMARH